MVIPTHAPCGFLSCSSLEAVTPHPLTLTQCLDSTLEAGRCPDTAVKTLVMSMEAACHEVVCGYTSQHDPTLCVEGLYSWSSLHLVLPLSKEAVGGCCQFAVPGGPALRAVWRCGS